ncbi:TRAP transporter large permease [Biomaibacter acetigenes]|uniref:TRAP transporter large permease n=2 Tax=Biomaibacter acetigenes TaxID=2316383 RepID=A0A3G2R359_9FIRM|nr:TRAP transporter large permease [Biomaibacter acetigenes]
MMAILFLLLAVFCLMGLPVAFAIALASTYGVISAGNIPLMVVVQRMFTQIDSFPLMAVPFFMLAGNLMDRGGISLKIINFASNLVGHIKGGLAMVSVVASMFFAGISGSASADSAAIGSVLIPAMEKKNYGKSFAASLTATAGSIGVIIPPSIPMVIYAITGSVSIGKLFLGGYIPGLMIGLGLMAVSFYFAITRGYPAEPRASLKSLWKSFVESIWALLMVVIIMGGILTGAFTATEASVVAVVYAIIVGMFVYKQLKLSDLPRIFIESGVTTAVVMFCVAATAILSWILTNQQVPVKMAAAILAITQNPIIILILINIILLFLGTILDTTPAIILIVPILLPIVTKLGVDPIHFGLITVTNLAIGMSTPPVGITLFVSSGIANLPMSKMLKSLVPFWAVMVFILGLITFVPGITMYLPNKFMP